MKALKALALCLCFASLGYAQAQSAYKIAPLPGEGGSALLVDSAARRIYVARSNHLVVLDIDTGRQLADLADLPDIGGIAVARVNNRGYVTNSKENRVSIFDLATFDRLGQIPLGDSPGPIVYDKAGHRFFALNRGSKNVSAIDADDGEVEDTIDLGGVPSSAVATDDSHIYVTLEDRGEIVEIDAREEMPLTRHWPIAGCQSPHGVALNATGRLLVNCANRLAIVDAKNGSLIALPPIGSGGGEVVADSTTGAVYVSNTDGSISMLKESDRGSYDLIGVVHGTDGTSELAFDAVTHKVFALTHNAVDLGLKIKPGLEKAARDSRLLIIGK
jgi:DNA-binding beta-propeller fold protein YncE